MARKYHPDVNRDPGAEAQFKRISEAYHVLSDPESRAQYDRFGADFRQYARAGADASEYAGTRPGGRTRAGGPGGYTWSSASDMGGNVGVDWDSIFGDVFGAARGMDATAELELSVEEAFRGGRQTIRLADAAGGQQSYEIEIPPGAVDGQRIRVPGAGSVGRGGGGTGDLIITLRVRSDRRFRIDGANIEMDLPISPWEAALGAQVPARAPGGPVNVRVPAGSSSGRRLRLRVRGCRVGANRPAISSRA